MLFDDPDFIAGVRSRPIVAVATAIDRAMQRLQDDNEWSSKEYEGLLEAYSFVAEMIAGDLISSDVLQPELTDQLSDDCVRLREYLRAVRTEIGAAVAAARVEDQRAKFALLIGTKFSYEFTQGDLDRAQTLLNELRSEITQLKDISEEHRQRVLESLERMQKELHKKVSDFDRFYGMAVQVSSLVRRVGTDAKPIVDRVRELLGIAWETQARGDELPSGTEPPLLPTKNPADSA